MNCPKCNEDIFSMSVHYCNTKKKNTMDQLDFIMACEDGSLTQEQFDDNAQAFVDSGVWKHLQGSWQRMVINWADQGLVEL
jgi:hypothetical protein